MTKLYTYWRSSAAYRVRIGLALKGMDAEHIPVHLVRDGGEHLNPSYGAINPQNLVPSLVLDGGEILTQSLAILEYLDEIKPEPAFLPQDALSRAHARALAQAVAVDIHPLNNLRVLNYLTETQGFEAGDKEIWCQQWINTGFSGLEKLLEQSAHTGEFCFGDAPGLADICLVPQVYNARRFNVDLTPYPNILRIDENCCTLAAFETAKPENQPDAQVAA